MLFRSAGAEVLALGAQHDGPDARLVVEVEDGVGETGEHLEVEPVVRRAVDLDGGDEICNGGGDVGAHRPRNLPQHAGNASPRPCGHLRPPSQNHDVPGVGLGDSSNDKEPDMHSTLKKITATVAATGALTVGAFGVAG